MINDSVHSYTYDAEGNVTAPNNGVTKAQVYCAADVAINYALGFIPGYNAAKLVGTLSGANFNFIHNLAAGKSIVTFDNGATIKDPATGNLVGSQRIGIDVQCCFDGGGKRFGRF